VNSPKGTAFLYLLDTSYISITTNVGWCCGICRENVVKVVIDNSANFKVARELLMQKW